MACAAAFALAGCGSHAAAPSRPAVARIGEEQIAPKQFQQYLAYSMRYYLQSGSLDPAAMQCTQTTASPDCARLRQQVLARLLQENVALQYARAHGITLNASDRAREAAALKDPAMQAVPDKTFAKHVLERQILIQKVEDAVAPSSVRRGLSFHIIKYSVPLSVSRGAHAAYQQALDLATSGSPSADVHQRTEWEAPFRLPGAIRHALAYAGPGQFVGPFRGTSSYLVVQYLGKAVHRYGTPAREDLTSRFFHIWIRNRLRRAHPQCFGSHQHVQPCPL